MKRGDPRCCIDAEGLSDGYRVAINDGVNGCEFVSSRCLEIVTRYPAECLSTPVQAG